MTLAAVPKQNTSLIKSYRAIDFTHFHWSPHLYLSELHRLRIRADKVQLSTLSKLLCQLFRMLEEVIFSDDQSSIDQLLATSSAYLQQLQPYLLEKRELSAAQFKSFEAKILHLEVTHLSDSGIKDLAVEQLSSLLSKCRGVVQAESEIQYLAFILDRFLKPQVANTEATDDFQLIIYNSFHYLVPLRSIRKIIALEPRYFTSPTAQSLFYMHAHQALKVIDANGLLLSKKPLQKLALMLEQQDGSEVLMILDQLGIQLHNVAIRLDRRTVLHDDEIYFKAKTTVATK